MFYFVRNGFIIGPAICVIMVDGLVENQDLIAGNLSNDDVLPWEINKAWNKHENKS